MMSIPGSVATAQPLRIVRGVWPLAILALVASACATPSATPSAAPSASATATPTASPTPSPEPTASPSAEATCDSDRPTSVSADWQRVEAQSGNFSFDYPEDWENITGLVRFNASGVVDEDTFAESDLQEGPIEADSVRNPLGFPNFSVFEVPGVSSSLEEIYDRQETRLATLQEFDEFDRTDVEACVGDEPARALDMFFFDRIVDPATGETELTDDLLYQQSWWIVHDDDLYYVQWLDEDRSDIGILEEILRTWQWSDGTPSQPSGGEDPFELAATADGVDESREDPDPGTFTSVFTSDAATIYVVYRLDSGLSGTVNVSWSFNGAPYASAPLDLPEGRWAWSGIEPPSGGSGFPTGDWEVELEFAETGGTRTLEFTVEPAG